MFTIASTRIVGLIAVVCAVIAAPQALAAPSTHSRIAPPDAVQGYDLSGFDLSDLNTIPGYQQQHEYLQGLVQAEFTARLHTSANAATFVYKPTNPGWGAAATAAKKSAAVPAPALAVKTAPGWVCNGQAEYDYVYSGCE